MNKYQGIQALQKDRDNYTARDIQYIKIKNLTGWIEEETKLGKSHSRKGTK